MKIVYLSTLDKISELEISGFFVGWPNPPNEEVLMKIFKRSYRVILATDKNKLVGFINALSDGVLSSYIPLLEVLPEYQGKGIGKELFKRMKKELEHMYMIDLVCDEDLVLYYEKLGMIKSNGAMIRNYKNQNGENEK